MKTLLLSIAAVTLGITAGAAMSGCERALPSGVAQNHGDAPLILDLDAAVGSQSSSGTLILGRELNFTVRGANKGHGEVGGATATFLGVGTGGTVCVILDPENVWNVIEPTDNGDINASNGDSDLYVGKTSDYTGVAGSRIGDFNGVYTDPLGVTHPLDNNVCVQTSDINGNTGAHAGAGAPEFCDFQADAGVSYTILAKTFSVPTDDDLLTEAIRVDPTPCSVSIPGDPEAVLTSDNVVPGGGAVPPGFNDPPAYVP